MRKLTQRFVLGFASVLALGIVGAAPDYAADAGNQVNAGSIPALSQTLERSRDTDNLRNDDIRWAQVELRNRGLYKRIARWHLGPGHQAGADTFSIEKWSGQTAALDEQTWEELTSDRGVAQGSSILPSDGGAGSITNWSGAGK